MRDINYFQGVLFKPGKSRSSVESSNGVVKDEDRNSDDQTRGLLLNITGSFRNDPIGFPYKSSQQLNIDFSKFENHTFFNSARSKTHTAFDRILNSYPFDGNFKEITEFLDSLTGFEKFIFDKIPKNKGFLRFDRVIADSVGNGTSLSVDPYISISSTDNTPTSVDKLSIRNNPFTLEFSIFVPSGSQNKNEVIAQRINGPNLGFTIALSSSEKSSSPEGKFPLFIGISSGSSNFYFTEEFNKGVFQSFSIVFDRGRSNKVNLYNNGNISKISNNFLAGDLSFDGSKLTIGSGSLHSFGSFNFKPELTLSGALDEFRFFTKAKSAESIKKYHNKSIWAEPGLNLYYKFNEPSGSFDIISNNSDLILDYSGNSLHSKVQNFNIRLRNPIGITTNLTLEDEKYSPVLFPSYNPLSDLAKEMVSSGSLYDANNPNLITNLIPEHYLIESAIHEGFDTIDGQLDDQYDYSSDKPGGFIMPSSQIITSLLFLWADKFDEIKIFIDEFKKLKTINYRNIDDISDQMLPFLAKHYSFDLPALFKNSKQSQFLDGQNILPGQDSSLSLKKIQSTIWRRILTDAYNITSKRGTIDGIQSILRNMGVNPSSPYRIKEYGGGTTNTIRNLYEKRIKNIGMLYFSGSRGAGSLGGDRIHTAYPILKTGFLSGSRTEPGSPGIAGSFINGLSNNKNDGLFTSGSWALESRYKLAKNSTTALTQSLLRLHTTGSQTNSSTNNYLIFNLLATNNVDRDNSEGKITLVGKPGPGASDPVLSLDLNVNIFDGNNWSISWGRIRADHTGSVVSSSYYIRAGRTGTYGLQELYKTSSFFDDSGSTVLNTINSTNNASGSFIMIGSMSLDTFESGNGFTHLNSVSNFHEYTDFSGKVTGVRFFSKPLTEQESSVHIRNPFSVGVEDPRVNFSFANTSSGSFARLRADISIHQHQNTTDANGSLKLTDFSQNYLPASISGFPSSTRVIKPVRMDYEILSPKFEQGIQGNKIRPRSFSSSKLAIDNNVDIAPVYDIADTEKSIDDRRVGVEVSAVQALDDDIVNIFANLDFFDNAIGNPELLFSREYRALRNVRKVYFNRLDNKLDIKKFFEFFKWFDTTVGDIIEDMIPSTSRYMGTNFVVESHMLERQKMVYNYQDMYVGELDRLESTSIFLQQFVLHVRKY